MVTHFEKRANIDIYKNSVSAPNRIGGGYCHWSGCQFPVTPLEQGWQILATQTVDNVTSNPTLAQHRAKVEDLPAVVTPPRDPYLDPATSYETLLPPEIRGPLSDCMKVVPVAKVAEGALVELFDRLDKSPVNTHELADPLAKARTSRRVAELQIRRQPEGLVEN